MKKGRKLIPNLDDEIAWLRSFGWSNQRIADRFGIQLDSVYQRDHRKELECPTT